MTSPRPKTSFWPDLRPATQIGERLLASTPFYPFGRVAEKLFALEQLDQLHSAGREDPFFESLDRQLNLRCECTDEEVQRIPEKGPVLIVSNHPFGLAEGPILVSLLARRRTDFRFLANSLLANFESLREYVIPVDPFGGKGAVKSNLAGLRAAIDWLRRERLLVMFPAGEVSSLRLPEFRIGDPAWSETIGRLARITRATVVPVFFHGANSAAFQVAGLIHPRLRTALLPRELLVKIGRTIKVSVGSPVPPRVAERLSDDQLTAYLRLRTELLRSRKLALREHPGPLLPKFPVVRAQPGDRIAADVGRLTPLLTSGPFQVYFAAADQLPHALREIGRLREITFRLAGEGTGKPYDLDRFDQWYRHLFVWNTEAGQIVGAYRIGLADSILAERGPRGLYTSTLFKFDPDFLGELSPALELGRSFVRREYQRDYHPLLLLWKGIGQVVAQNPRYRTLLGPVSVSNDYQAISRALIVEFCKARRDPLIRGTVQPRQRFQQRPLGGCDASQVSAMAETIAELSSLIAEIEPDEKGVPVLLRQYLNLGGSVLEFNVDRRFSNAVDGLIVVDLHKADRRLLERYMGRKELAAYELFHGHTPADRGQAVIDLQH